MGANWQNTVNLVTLTEEIFKSGGTERTPLETLHKKWSFPFRISSINMTKSAENCEFGHITEEVFKGKLHFLCSEFMLIYIFVGLMAARQKNLKKT